MQNLFGIYFVVYSENLVLYTPPSENKATILRGERIGTVTPGILLHLLKLGKKRRAEPSAVIAQEGSLLGAPVHEMSGTLASLLQAF